MRKIAPTHPKSLVPRSLTGDFPGFEPEHGVSMLVAIVDTRGTIFAAQVNFEGVNISSPIYQEKR